MSSGRGRATTAITAAIDLSTVCRGVTSEVRSCGACAYVPCMTCTSPPTNPTYSTLVTTAPHWPCVHTITSPCVPAHHASASIQTAPVPPQRACERCTQQLHVPSPPTPTLTGDPRLAATATSRSGSTAGEFGRAPTPVTAIAGLSVARGDRPSEVRSGTHIPHMPRVHMHHIQTLTNTAVTVRTLHQPRAYISPDACELAYCPPQALRPPRRGCRGGHRSGRSGHGGSPRSLCVRADGRRHCSCVGQHG